ncbi:MAG: 50S ribosomal protein L21 [Acidobacteriota bacterium]|nr:50S ribosomal protein L21 [Acidobacteriota bacterium]
MYAVIQTGGKQHRVKVGEIVRVESVPGNPGDKVEFDRVLLVGEGKKTKVGTPTVEGATVKATVVEQGQADKILVFNFKRRKNSNRKKQGHRQAFTAVKIESIKG